MVIRGQAGEGKTALAAELATWLVRSNRMERAAFFSLDGSKAQPVAALLESLGAELLPGEPLDDLIDLQQKLNRALRESATIIIIDSLESLLPHPWTDPDDPPVAVASLHEFFELCQLLVNQGETRLVFTLRELLPRQFIDERFQLESEPLDWQDAMRFVEAVLASGETNHSGSAGDPEALARATAESIDSLIDVAQRHVHTLALLAPHLRTLGVDVTARQVGRVMQEIDREHHGSPERSLFASVQRSLDRLSAVNRERSFVLGVFYGEVDLAVLEKMTELEPKDSKSLIGELVHTGLARPTSSSHFLLHPALCPYLRGQLSDERIVGLEARWSAALQEFVRFLVRDRFKDPARAAMRARLAVPNLLALLDRSVASDDAEATIDLATQLRFLVFTLGEPRASRRSVMP